MNNLMYAILALLIGVFTLIFVFFILNSKKSGQ